MSVWEFRRSMAVGYAGDRGVLVVHPWSGRWQLTHARLPSAERRASKKSRFPSSTFSGVIGLPSGTGAGGSGPSSVGAPAQTHPYPIRMRRPENTTDQRAATRIALPISPGLLVIADVARGACP